jgi:NADH-quinone oxidoreductase subunit H
MEYGTDLFTAVVALVKIVFMVLLFAMPLASILTWMERRQSAMMQDRLGPNRANIPLPFGLNWRMWGITHFIADAIKFMAKEDFVPPKAHKFLFMWAPIMAMAPALIVSAIVPFGAPICWGQLLEPLAKDAVCAQPVRLQIAQLDAGLLFYFAISSLSVYGATLAGWASHNKWAMMGGLRASSQMMSYEVTMGMAVLGSFLVCGTLEPGAMVAHQQHFFDINDIGHSWGIFSQPLGFLLFLTAAIAETKRTPFDIPEGEPEIIGYFVEYSGLRFGMFFLGEFLEIVFSSAIMVTIFFGGWKLPGLEQLFTSFPGHWYTSNAAYAFVTLNVWVIKVFLFCSFQLLIRWSLPRFRSDQLMRLGWQRLLPVSIANVVATALVVLYALKP